MKKIFSSVGFILLFASNGSTQNVAINTTGAAAVASAILDVTSTTAGVLIPRMTAAQRAAIAAPATSLLVYQTDAGTQGAGFYFYNGAAWVPFGTNNGDWGLQGNTGTSAATNYIGTTDATDLVIRTTATERARMTSGGNFGIGDASPAALLTVGNGDLFQVISTGHARNIDGTAALPAWSFVNSTTAGMYRIGADILGLSTASTERIRIVASGRVAINSAVAAPSGMLEVQGNFAAAVGNDGVTVTRNSNASGIAIGAAGQAGTWNGLAGGSGGAFVGNTVGITSYTTSGGVAQTGYFFDAFGAAWRIGYWSGAAYYKINGTGAVSTNVPDLEGKPRIMSCPEAPENLYFDYGVGKLENGKIHVNIDPILAKNIIVDEKHPLKVFIQLEGQCSGVYVTNKTATGFDVVELDNGSSNVPFSYNIVATMGDQTVRSPEGNSRTAKYDSRWPRAAENEKTIYPLKLTN